MRPGSLDGPPDACNSIDDDCDGSVDEGCPCTSGSETPCYTGAAGTEGVGRCAAGFQLCVDGMLQVTCNDQLLPDVEICDTLDNDCDGLTNEDVLRTYYRDGDGDGFGLATESITACSPPAGYVSASNDCADDNANINPGAFDGCNGLDDDCDGATDEGAPPRAFYLDADGDGFGALATTVTGCDQPAGYVLDSTDCDDATSATNPAAFDRCDGVNNDCDATTDEGCACTDGTSMACDVSTVGVCRTGSQLCVAGAWGSCLGSVRPGAETCNGLDDDCDGAIDDGVTVTCYADADSDGYGSGSSVQRCPDASRTSVGNCPSGYTNVAGDCNDVTATINPLAVERCDGINNDCDATTDEGCACTDGTSMACDVSAVGICRPGTQLCASGAWGACLGSVRPGSETCNGLDDDCDGTIDDGVTITCYADGDSDAYGTGASVQRCADLSRTSFGTCPSGYTGTAGDCNDANGSVHPLGTEACNGIDDDCDSSIDEGVKLTYHQDVDGDGFGATAVTLLACSAPAGYVVLGTDCNDADASINPAATERCDGVNNNCNATTDEGCLCTDGTSMACDVSSVGVCRPGTQLCVAGAWGACLGSVRSSTEVCNGRDDDCDGSTDEALSTTCYADADGDGRGAGLAYQLCGASPGVCPAGWSTLGNDCNDGNASVSPAAAETCNGRDDDCDGVADDGPGFVCVQGATRAGNGAYLLCASVPGLFTCASDCRSETFTASVAPESCDGADNNCNGVADDGLACVRSSTGNGCTTSCGTVGTYICSATCTIGACRAGVETCNGCDDDGVGGVDNGFTCALGTSRSCSTACGTAGTQRCLGDCSGYEACHAATETCNGCDDDLNGAVDETFACERGRIYSCTTACGTAGTRTCTASCGLPASCTAPGETCNYCDDDGDGTFQDDAALATDTSQPTLRCSDGWRFSGGASCTADSAYLPGTITHFVNLGSTAGWTGTAAWRTAPLRMGWGAMRVRAYVQMRRNVGSYPGEGFAIVISKGGSGDVGGAAEVGVPLWRRGLSFEWRFWYPDWTVDSTDRLFVRRLDGTGAALPYLTAGSTGFVDSYVSGLDWASPDTYPGVTRRIDIVYTPDDPRTAGDEEALNVQVDGTTKDAWGGTLDTILANEFVPGDTIEIGIVSATGGYTSALRMETQVYVTATSTWAAPNSYYQLSNVCF